MESIRTAARRGLAGALGASVLVLALALPGALQVAAARPPGSATPLPGPCPLAHPDTNALVAMQTWSRALIRCAADRWPVPGGAKRAICIARRESGLNPRARSPHKLYLGLFQHSAKDWKRRFRVWTVPSWQLGPSALNPRTNAIVTMRMVHAARSWSAWGRKGC